MALGYLWFMKSARQALRESLTMGSNPHTKKTTDQLKRELHKLMALDSAMRNKKGK